MEVSLLLSLSAASFPQAEEGSWICLFTWSIYFFFPGKQKMTLLCDYGDCKWTCNWGKLSRNVQNNNKKIVICNKSSRKRTLDNRDDNLPHGSSHLFPKVPLVPVHRLPTERLQLLIQAVAGWFVPLAAYRGAKVAWIHFISLITSFRKHSVLADGKGST